MFSVGLPTTSEQQLTGILCCAPAPTLPIGPGGIRTHTLVILSHLSLPSWITEPYLTELTTGILILKVSSNSSFQYSQSSSCPPTS